MWARSKTRTRALPGAGSCPPADGAGAITLDPIGLVRNSITVPEHTRWRDVLSHIVIHPEYTEALDALEGYSHLMVLFWMNRRPAPRMRHVPQNKRTVVPEVGIFACRCPQRPNPVGCTTVPILGITGNVLAVRGLDAVHLTPVIDIKPYTPQYDLACPHDEPLHRALSPGVRVPDWVFRLAY